MTFWEIIQVAMAIAIGMMIVRFGVLWITQLVRDIYEILAGKRRSDQ